MNEFDTEQPARSEEEVAWDKEFKDEEKSGSVASDLAGIAIFASRLPGALLEAAASMVPEETTRHSRAAARETFLALRSLLGAIGDNIESMLAEPGTKPNSTPETPGGTWTGSRPVSASQSKVKRIEIGDDPDPASLPGDLP